MRRIGRLQASSGILGGSDDVGFSVLPRPAVLNMLLCFSE